MNELEPPMITRVVTDPLLPDHGDQPCVWVFASPHPLDATSKIIKMYLERGYIIVYYAAPDGKGGTMCLRNFIPMDRVRLFEEKMQPDVFKEEIENSDNGIASCTLRNEDDDEPDPDDGPEFPASVPMNGPAAAS